MSTAQQLYNRTASLYDLVFGLLLIRGQAIRNFVKNGNYLKESSRTLDAGCGSGLVTKALWQAAQDQNLDNLTFHAFDFSPVMLKRFRSWINQAEVRVDLIQADARRLDQELPDTWRNYHLIVSAGLVEYLPADELPGILRQLAARLAPGGQLLLFVSRRNWFTRLFITGWWRARTFTQDEFAQVLKQAGVKHYRFPQFSRSPRNWSTMIVEINN